MGMPTVGRIVHYRDGREAPQEGEDRWAEWPPMIPNSKG